MSDLEFYLICTVLVAIGAYIAFRLLSPAKQAQQAPVSKPESKPESNRDPVLHYEVTKGNFGDSKRQALTYKGKKVRWK